MVNLLEIGNAETELPRRCNMSGLAEEQILGGIVKKNPIVRREAARIVLPQGWGAAFTAFLFNRLQFNRVHSYGVRRDQENSRLLDESLDLGKRPAMPYLPHSVHNVQHGF